MPGSEPYIHRILLVNSYIFDNFQLIEEVIVTFAVSHLRHESFRLTYSIAIIFGGQVLLFFLLDDCPKKSISEEENFRLTLDATGSMVAFDASTKPAKRPRLLAEHLIWGLRGFTEQLDIISD